MRRSRALAFWCESRSGAPAATAIHSRVLPSGSGKPKAVAVAPAGPTGIGEGGPYGVLPAAMTAWCRAWMSGVRAAVR